MPGGLLNLIAEGNHNRILTGNPTKTHFKATYAKHTNFGLQKFRIDFSGQRNLMLDSSSFFDFKVPRHGDLLMDTYLVVNLPTIWSSIHPPTDNVTSWRPYEFRWIRQIGSQLIKSVSFTIGGHTIQEFSGDYMVQMVERDFDSVKKELYHKMTGHVEELYDPEQAFGNYPNAYFVDASEGAEPSIRARKLFIPINCWFSLASEMAFPINCLEYNELHIKFELRPVKELFTIKQIPQKDGDSNERKSPSFNDSTEQFYRFIHPPPSYYLEPDDYADKRTQWNADVHLISTYAFLSEEENQVFIRNTQTYLLRQSKRYIFPHIVGVTKVQIESHGMVSSWLWHFRRSDSSERNEWSNYSNWAYTEQRPYGLESFVEDIEDTDGKPVYVTGSYKADNERSILKKCGILFDGKTRENVFDAGVYDYIEKYVRTSGNAHEGIYCYHFGIRTSPSDIQPNGAVNTTKFKKVEFEIDVMNPPLDPDATVTTICDDDGNIIGIKKTTWDMYLYSYEMTVYEERYNVLILEGGNASMLFS